MYHGVKNIIGNAISKTKHLTRKIVTREKKSIWLGNICGGKNLT